MVDLTNAAAAYPQFLDIGGNTGKVNTFTGVSITNLTGGVYNAQTLAQGNNAACFVTQFLQQAAPDVLEGLFSDATAATAALTSELGSVSSKFSCPQIAKIDTSNLNQFPGYAKSYANYAPEGNGL